MGYKVIAGKDEMDQMRVKYGPRKGLEGPFNFSGRVLYYDPKEGLYYDPTTDFYVERDEMDIINNRLMEVLARA
jgi:OCRE domain